MKILLFTILELVYIHIKYLTSKPDIQTKKSFIRPKRKKSNVEGLTGTQKSTSVYYRAA